MGFPDSAFPDSVFQDSAFHGDSSSSYSWPPLGWPAESEHSVPFCPVSVEEPAFQGQLPGEEMQRPPDSLNSGVSKVLQAQAQAPSLEKQSMPGDLPGTSIHDRSQIAIASDKEPSLVQVNPINDRKTQANVMELEQQKRPDALSSSNSERGLVQVSLINKPDLLGKRPASRTQRHPDGGTCGISDSVVQITRLDELASLSQRLENFYQRMSTEPLQDLGSCKLCPFFQTSSRN